MELNLRSVQPEDMDLLYRWANDPVTRENAFHTEQIPYERHRQWFESALADETVVMYICMNQEKPVGQIRFNISDEQALISYSVDRDNRGCGVGTKLLMLAEIQLRDEFPRVRILKGEVKYGNIASMKAFERNGYGRKEQEAYVEFKKVTGEKLF